MSTRTFLLETNGICSRFFKYTTFSANTPRVQLSSRRPIHIQRHLPPIRTFTLSINSFLSNPRRGIASKNLIAEATESVEGSTTAGSARKGKLEELNVTEQAAKQLVHLAQQEGQPDQALRITVESGGCHGFQYHLNLTTKVERDDVCFEKDGAKVLVDQLSLSFIEGSKLEFVQELIGSAFRVTQNPKATTGCGCGTSFGV